MKPTTIPLTPLNPYDPPRSEIRSHPIARPSGVPLTGELRLKGFLFSCAFSYLAGGLGWTLAGLFTLFTDPRGLLGFLWIGFVPAGMVHLGSYFIPGAILWAVVKPGSPLTRCGWALPVGFLVGSLPILLLGKGAPESLLFAPLLGLVYGAPTAGINLLVLRHLTRL